jgi:hypothetical protein
MTKYHIPESCNKCQGENNFINPYYEETGLYETRTKCKQCGFEDYWAYGFFESSSKMTSNCKTYSFDT